jgi:hypothetical protein
MLEQQNRIAGLQIILLFLSLINLSQNTCQKSITNMIIIHSTLIKHHKTIEENESNTNLSPFGHH